MQGPRSKLGNKEGAWVGIPFGAMRALVSVLERGRGEGVEGEEGGEWIGMRMRGGSVVVSWIESGYVLE